MKKILANGGGFTLVEMIVCVTIVAVLAGVAYPAYTRFLTDSQASTAQSVILALAAAEKVERQASDPATFTTGTPPSPDNDGDGYYELGDGNGCYTIGSTIIDLGEASDFEFLIYDVTADTFKVRARGNGSGLLATGDSLIFSYDATANPRSEWIASGSLTAP